MKVDCCCVFGKDSSLTQPPTPIHPFFLLSRHSAAQLDHISQHTVGTAWPCDQVSPHYVSRVIHATVTSGKTHGFPLLPTGWGGSMAAP